MNNPNFSESDPIPLLTMTPPEEHNKRQLQLVTNAPFRLPDDWLIEEKRRPLTNISTPGKIDRYYIEPSTGMKFRSLASVQRYLTDGQIETHTRKYKAGDDCIRQFTKRSSSFVLPDDWEIEEKPRNSSRVRVDKTYIEPGSGYRFRSLAAVERYLTGANEDTSFKALMPAKPSVSPCSGGQKMKSLGDIQSQIVVSTSQKRNTSGESVRASKLKFGSRTPEKVNWVLAGPGGNMWNPIINDSKVPDSVTQKWSERFISVVYGIGGSFRFPSS